ncbi:MAG: type III-A CRISPR-associated RAMP protein Csm4 [Okeania sp. SIO2H7]|nr:type III-A CRISPR-associated RAMP protein Csm4 [Okeania sp. SIO2H7]
MGEWKLFRLEFGRNLAHFGELGIGMESTNEMVRSDTLFSGWIGAYVRLFPDKIDELIEKFNSGNQPPFRLSSTFIYRKVGEEIIDYLPRPSYQRPLNYPPDDLEFAKEYKKLNYLPLSVWQRWYQGEGFSEEDKQELIAKAKKEETTNRQLENAGTFDYRKGFETEKIPKIVVDRTTGATNIYYVEFVRYQSEANGNDVNSLAGLYFLAYFSEPDFSKTFSAVLNFLGEEGMGGLRSRGAGQFTVTEISILPNSIWHDVLNFSGGQRHGLISLFWDNNLNLITEDEWKNSSYELLKRSGWIVASPTGVQKRRQSVQMFAEGSVFPFKPEGKLADVTPDGFTAHKVYRSGISVSLPIKIKEEKNDNDECGKCD